VHIKKRTRVETNLRCVFRRSRDGRKYHVDAPPRPILVHAPREMLCNCTSYGVDAYCSHRAHNIHECCGLGIPPRKSDETFPALLVNDVKSTKTNSARARSLKGVCFEKSLRGPGRQRRPSLYEYVCALVLFAPAPFHSLCDTAFYFLR
jgi:hypothetical protein